MSRKILLVLKGIWACVSYLVWKFSNFKLSLTDRSRIQDRSFRGFSCHTYPTIMKLGAVIPYFNKIRKIHKSRDTPLEFCRHKDFPIENQQLFLYQEIQIRFHFNT